MSRWNRRPATDDADTGPGFTGVARFARRGDAADRALRSGDIAVVDLADLDRPQAEALVERGVRAVVNTASSSTGRYPNLGPRILADAGVPLVDHVGPGIRTRLRSGDTIRVEGGKIFKDEVLVAQGATLDDAAVTASLGEAERGLATRLESLTANASDHLERERDLLLGGARVPRLPSRLRKRPTVVVTKAHGWESDLKLIRRWLRDHDAVVVAVTDAADALLAAGITPHVLVGPVDRLSDRALRTVGEVVVTSASGRESGHERFEKAGVDVQLFVATGSPTDLAILLADTNEAAVIVEVGAPDGLVEFLERGPVDVASSFVTRLRAGSRLVDAKAVGHLTGRSMALWPVLLVLLAGLVAVVVAVGVTPVGQDWLGWTGDRLVDLRSWIEGLFS